MVQIKVKSQLVISSHAHGIAQEISIPDGLDGDVAIAVLNMAECLYDNGYRVNAIKNIRSIFNCSLREAKDLVENLN